jgi:hypothetical protein
MRKRSQSLIRIKKKKRKRSTLELTWNPVKPGVKIAHVPWASKDLAFELLIVPPTPGDELIQDVQRVLVFLLMHPYQSWLGGSRSAVMRVLRLIEQTAGHIPMVPRIERRGPVEMQRDTFGTTE